MRTIAVAADADAAAGPEIGHGIEEAVAEVAFGSRAQAGDDAGTRQALRFDDLGMGGVQQAPA
eukprot:gene17504-23776_t